MKFALCCSGSKGNCFVLEQDDCLLVVDCGSTKRRIEQSFSELNLNLSDVDACLLTHQHKDHSSQIKMFSNTTIYSSKPVDGQTVEIISSLNSFNIKGIKITPIELSHDDEKTMGFIFESKEEKLVYITDTGYLNQSYFPLLKNATYIILESNHDIDMLMKTNRPHFTKSRIYSDNGHLCNEDCAEILESIVGSETKQIVLAHLSEEANTPQKALEVSVNQLMNKKEVLHPELTIMISSQYKLIQGGIRHEKSALDCTYCLIGMV